MDEARRGRGLWAGGAAAVALALALPAGAFEFFDGRVEVHGFFEEQIRALGEDLDTSNDLDLSQWYHVLNIEIEAELAPKGIGPLEIVEAFVRVEARYDCIWTHACGIFPSADVYGDRASHFPQRLLDGRRSGLIGNLRTSDRRRWAALNRETQGLENRDRGRLDPIDPLAADRVDPLPGSRDPLTYDRLPGLVTGFANSYGPGRRRSASLAPLVPFRVLEPIGAPTDDAGVFYFRELIGDCLFGAQDLKGGEDGRATRILGPWNPGCRIVENGRLRHLPNPLNPMDVLPILDPAGVDGVVGFNAATGVNDDPMIIEPTTGQLVPVEPFGRSQLPYRPAPLFAADDPTARRLDAQGLYYPSAPLRREIRSGRLDSIQQNFRESELAWNRGESQQQTKELKEAYLDIEAVEGRLWLRLGKQSIVWGKTELFRTTDQFNPQDLALSSLPDLEASRVALWAARGTWSFYDLGPLEDVRLELAVNYDSFQPADLGRCGEAYALDVVCGLTAGYFFHGLTGVGLVGRDEAPDPWNSLRGLEAGGRVEFRYGRFSFQLSDFYGFSDFPYPDRITTYERNVDPLSGRPRRIGATGPCATGFEPACLGRVDAVAVDGSGIPIRVRDGVVANPTTPAYNIGTLVIDDDHRRDVLGEHHANLTLFASACAITVGVANEDVRACGFTAVNTQTGPGGQLSTNANGFSALLAGSPNANIGGVNTGFIPALLPQVRLNREANDDGGIFDDGFSGLFILAGEGLSQHLSWEQQALLGCGPFFSTSCDIDGIDLLNTEAGVFVQSWPGIEGTSGGAFDWDLGDPTRAQPGTLGFAGGPVATRFVGGQLAILPGARSPLDPGWVPTVDGCIRPTDPGCDLSNGGAGARILAHPIIASAAPSAPTQIFRTELAAASFNAMMIFAARSDPDDPNDPTLSEFDRNDPNGLGVIQAGPNAGQVRRGVDPALVDGVTPVACGFRKPQLCENVHNFLNGIGLTRNSVRAGGSSRFGRRDFPWHQSGELVLRFQKRNVLGFAMDFTEDRTKTSWGVEATWIEGEQFVDNDRRSGLSAADTFNLTVSADRPTFVNFLNPNRSFLFNTQWFFQYVDGYQKGFLTNGPFNVLATFTIFTGYFQDRLLLFYTTVYDFGSNSGAFLPTTIYRFTENFSASIGVNLFFGREELRRMPIVELRPTVQRTGAHAYKDAVENGLSALRDRDEIRLTLRYTF